MALHLLNWDQAGPLEAHAWHYRHQRRRRLPKGGEDGPHWDEAQAGTRNQSGRAACEG